MRIDRYAYSNTTEKYSLDINEELVKEYNEFLHKDYILPEDFVDLTLQDIVELYKEDSPRENEIIKYSKWEYKNWDGNCFLGTIIRELIDEDIWGCYMETVDGDTYDWDDEFIED